MTNIIEIKTKRLLLRQWRLSDFNFFARMNSNKKVMHYYPDTLTREQSDELALRIQQKIATNGWGFWAVEIPDVCEFIGFVGLNKPLYKLPVNNSEEIIEIGWRLANEYWGKGYATEAALSALDVGFNQLQFSEIFSFASTLNQASINVMKRLKMQNTHFYFNHPKISQGHILEKHCLYKINCKNWAID
jgi:RimJ/RimL family protein N-acetyltransferase